jgi:hypothetical protein
MILLSAQGHGRGSDRQGRLSPALRVELGEHEVAEHQLTRPGPRFRPDRVEPVKCFHYEVLHCDCAPMAR